MINGKIIKVCGMREAQNIRDVESLQKVDMMGFIFYPKSPRYLYELPAYLPTHARRVGVFVNEDKKVITMYADRFGLEYIQLHGKESPEYCQSLRASGLKIIKAFSVARPKDLNHVSEYEKACNLFLFDTKCEQYGGSGNQLKEFNHPRLAGYDLNSRFERKAGEKDPERIRMFLNELKS